MVTAFVASPIICSDPSGHIIHDMAELVHDVVALACRREGYAALTDYVLKRRRAAADGIAAAAQIGGEGGTVLHQLPDFLLPYLIQVWVPSPALPPSACCQRQGVQWRVLALNEGMC